MGQAYGITWMNYVGANMLASSNLGPVISLQPPYNHVGCICRSTESFFPPDWLDCCVSEGPAGEIHCAINA
jgi:hypothetical protein